MCGLLLPYQSVTDFSYHLVLSDHSALCSPHNILYEMMLVNDDITGLVTLYYVYDVNHHK